jgi:hypothetical protein
MDARLAIQNADKQAEDDQMKASHALEALKKAQEEQLEIEAQAQRRVEEAE